MKLLILLALSGCVDLEAMSGEERAIYLDKQEERQIRRAEKRAEAYDNYQKKALACRGYMVITRSVGELTAQEMNMAYCSDQVF